jgi:hypothetical protein
LACVSGCIGVREHWSDGFGWMWNRSWSQVAKHGPEVAADAAIESADSAVDDKMSGHETPRERQERRNEEFFDK